LDAEPGREIEAEEFLPRIPNAKINSLRSALARLAKQERIVRGERGKYRSVILPPAQSVGGEVET
jgi:predicted transcriptional regulator of viral defense system